MCGGSPWGVAPRLRRRSRRSSLTCQVSGCRRLQFALLSEDSIAACHSHHRRLPFPPLLENSAACRSHRNYLSLHRHRKFSLTKLIQLRQICTKHCADLFFYCTKVKLFLTLQQKFRNSVDINFDKLYNTITP